MSRIALLFAALFTLTVAGCAPANGVPPSGHQGSDGEGHDRVFSAADLKDRFDHVDGHAQSGVLQSEEGATRGAFLIDLWSDIGGAPVALEVRGVNDDGTTTEWMTVSETWREEPHRVVLTDLPGMFPSTQFRLPLEHVEFVEALVYAAVVPAEPDAATDEPHEDGKVRQGLTTRLSSLVQTRAAWGARATRCTSRNTTKHRMAIHHTFTPTSASGGYEARLRGIQAFHMDSRGWCDVGYHFLVTADGRIWEGRPLELLGSHVGSNNTGNIGISWVGCYGPGECDSISSSQIPPQATLDSAGRLIGELADMYGIGISSTNIKPHRGHSGASTTCPGDNLNARIPELFTIAKNGGSTPAPDPTPPPSATTGHAVGFVWDLASSSSPTGFGNKRITNATVSAGSASTTVRAGDAFYSLELPAGSHVLTASAPGYATSTTAIDVVAGAETWTSLGLDAGGTSSVGDLVVSVVGASGQALSGAIVYVASAGAERSSADGRVSFTLEPGTVEVQAFADGHAGASQTVNVPAGSQAVTLQLAAASNPSPSGRLQGVVWDLSKSSSPTLTSARLDGAYVLCSCGRAAKVRAGDAYFAIDASPGTYTYTVVAKGFTTKSFQHTVSSGASEWGSTGLQPGASGSGGTGTGGGSTGGGGTGGGGGTPTGGFASYGNFESSWTCPGTAGTKKASSGSYYVTSFGCWIDSSGAHRGDPSDNCIPWCQSGASGQGRKSHYDALCGGMSGPDCERALGWYTAGADRFGCGARVKVTNPKNGKSAILAVIDRGPACWVEDKVDHWVLDMSYPASYHLFNEQKSATERGEVIVQQVSDSTPLGPS